MTTEELVAVHGPLAQALRVAGGIQALARYLRVPKKQLMSWVEGEEATPPSVLARALAFVRAQ